MIFRKAIYGGSFDPITNGHLWVVEEGVHLFDHLYIAIGINSAKKGYFSLQERVEMIDEAIANIPGVTKDNCSILSFESKFLVDVASDIGCQFMLRGIRNTQDLEYELGIKNFNARLRPEIKTVFLAPPAELVGTSSSIVRGAVGIAGWEEAIADHVPENVVEQFRNKIAT